MYNLLIFILHINEAAAFEIRKRPLLCYCVRMFIRYCYFL